MTGYLEISLFCATTLAAGIIIYVWAAERRWQKKRQVLAKITDSTIPEDFQFLENKAEPPSTLLKPKPATHKISWRHERIHEFYKKHVLPYEKILGTSGYLKPVTTLLALLDAHGDCPSVVQADQDHEYQAIQTVYDLLSKITLLDHSLNVAEQMIAGVAKAKTRDPEMIMGKILVAALGP